jgi:myosin-5
MNALLEPFGNAHVEANANSSRFGKLVELQFVRDGLEVAGSRIRHYLLEKVCVTEQPNLPSTSVTILPHNPT